MLENAVTSKQRLPFSPCYGDYLVVFKANAKYLGKINNAALRNALVTAYIFAEGHIDTYQCYNRFLADY